MGQVYCATLKPASGGFGEYDWVERSKLDGCESFEDYEAILEDNPTDFELTEELSGRIHNERGRVYKFTREPECHEAEMGLTAEDLATYEMVWVEDE